MTSSFLRKTLFLRKALRLSSPLLTAALLLLSASSRPAFAQATPAPATLRVGVFARTLPMLAAQLKGFLAEENLTVSYLQVQSSTQQFTSLRDGQYDIINTAIDNVVNYRLNDSNPIGARLDVQSFMGTDYGTGLSLVSKPAFATFESLRGKRLGVDAPDSGFAYVLYKMMRQHGLERGLDYEVVVIGGVAARYNALLAGTIDATLLSGGFEVRAANAGYASLELVTEVADPYMSGVSAARQSWMEQNRDVVVRFIRANYAATQWSLDPANREEAIALLMTQPNTDRPLAEQLYDEQLNEETGLIPDLSIDRLGLYNVLKLREEFGGFDSAQNLRRLTTPPSGIYDLSYLRAALHH
ncbi:MAG TPA: ABC transporter substrate-binding protein [Pyrinomonadaceae bacterium]|jgi:ABC-type nitrate/sulfonate/bicarbonate transport system substrate-binding protein|nr:ABC transporter substrate-binding protein [Pyrinomonadaceae bacterium]